MPVVKREPWTAADIRIREWVLNHPGACKEIAAQAKVSAEYVRLVIYRKRGRASGGARKAVSGKMQEIVRALKTKGAPV